MGRFRVPFTREESGYIYFNAESEEEADVLLEQCERGERDVEDLDGFNFKNNAGSESIGTWAVEEVL
jgi:hypothetical protein